MKVLIFVSCAFAVVAASWIPTHKEYHGPLHYPVIHKGVPVEPAEVQHARDAHLAAVAKESVHSHHHHEEHHDDHHDDGQYRHHEHHGNNLDDGQYHHHEQQGNSLDDGQYREEHHDNGHYHEEQNDNGHYHEEPKHHHHKQAYETSHVKPAIDHHGKPLDTPEVEAAKAHHFAAVHKALSAVSAIGVNHHYRQRRSYHAQHHPIIDKHGVPVEPLEVQHARAEHLSHHAAAHHHSGYEHHDDYSHHEHGHHHEHEHKGHSDLHENKHGYTVHQKHAPVYGHHHEHYVPKYDYHGLPLDTEEVEHLKALHFAAHAKAHHHY